jgi:alpha-D-ribose 1-methylphosphonate 5-triphosphate synthase subunit PhnG
MAGIEKPGAALLARLAVAVGATPELVEYACLRARERRKARLAALAAAREAALR